MEVRAGLSSPCSAISTASSKTISSWSIGISAVQAVRSIRRRIHIAQHVADLDAVVDHLRQSLGQDKIILIGHSWGAALGLLYGQAHPDKLSAFIGVNLVVSTREGQQAQYNFVLAEASRRKDGKALARLRKIGAPPYKKVGQLIAMEALVDRYGGVFHRKPRRMWIVVRGIFSGLVTPREIWRIHRGIHVSLEAMSEELLGLDLARSVPSVDVPILFFLGRYDRHVDAKLAAAYFEELQAPVKRLIWFEKSAHNMPFEEPGLFNGTVVRELQSIGIRLAADEGMQRK
jgi:pimeloyl-ACP methyl ester carboxylesterase